MKQAARICVVLLFTLASFAQSGSGPTRITLEDLLSVEGPGTPLLSPDGRTLALTRNGQIQLMPSDGGWPVTLTTTTGGKSELDWSPDSQMLAYSSQGSIWVVSAAGGPPKRLTNAPSGSGDPRTAGDRSPQWSPKGKWLLFQTGRRGNIDLMSVSSDGVSTHVLTDTPGDEGATSWSPDGAHIAYTERTPQCFSGTLKILSFDAATGQAVGSPSELFMASMDRGGGWSIGESSWSPDGKQLAVVLQENGWDKVYLIPSAGGKPRQLTQGESEDESPAFSPDGKSVAFTSNRQTPEERHIWIAPVDGSAPHQLLGPGPGSERGPQWSADGSKLYFMKSTPLEPANLMVAAASGGTPKALTHTLPKNFERAGLRMPEVVRYPSKDGTTIAAILYKPINFKSGTKYPTVLWIHGGPEGQDTLDWDPWAQYLTQEGYAVLKPNYRGSRGYGEKFRNLNVEDSSFGEMDDVAAGAQHLVSLGIADPKRLAIGGGSHGGTMTAYAVVRYPDLFRAAIEMYGVVDRATFLERTNRPSAIRWAMKMGGYPAEKPDNYRKANMLLEVSKIKTPILILHGEQDPQVPPYESVQFDRELKKANKFHLYFTYPGEGHGFSQPQHRMDAWKKELAFLAKYLQPPFGQSLTSTEDFVTDKLDKK